MRAEHDGSGDLLAHSLREIVLYSALVSIVATLITGLVNGYFGAGLWYLVTVTLRDFVVLSLVVFAGFSFLSWAGRKMLPHRVYLIARTFVIFTGFFLLVSEMLTYSGIVLGTGRDWLPVELVQYGLSAAGAVALLFCFARISDRRKSLLGLRRAGSAPAVAVCSLAFLLPLAHGNEGTRMNILLITIDTLRADHLSCYGYERLTSPCIDDLAKKSVMFTNAIVQWPKTSPSFSSMMTGLYCGQAGVTGPRQRLPRQRITTAELLANAQFFTAAVVGNGNLGEYYSFDQGFSKYVEAWKDESVFPDENCDAANITDLALEVLQEARTHGEFFVWVHYVDPHAPYSPPPPYHEMFVHDEFYDTRTIPLNEGFNDDIGGCPLRSRLGDNANLHYYVAEYDAEIRYCDTELVRLFDYLDLHDLWPTTMVILTSDHGESLGEHNYYFEHGKLSYDTNLRVPLIIWYPGCRPTVVEEPVAILDLHPTILEYAGVNPGREYEGESLMPKLRGEEDDGCRPVFAQAGGEREQSWAIRTGMWKYIYVPSQKYRSLMKGTTYELYNLLDDPGETLNLFEPGDTLASRLKSDLDLWVSAQEAQMKKRDLPGESELDTEEESTRENLKALGYVQ